GSGGECVLLAFEPGLEFVVAFLGCLIAGRPAVPMRPPRTALDHAWFTQVAAKVGASCILVDRVTHARCTEVADAKPGLPATLLQRMQVLDWLGDADVV